MTETFAFLAARRQADISAWEVHPEWKPSLRDALTTNDDRSFHAVRVQTENVLAF